MKQYRLTLLFVATSVVAIVVGIVVVNHIIGRQAESNLIRIAEENTARDALHVVSMLQGRQSTHHPPGPNAGAASHGMDGMQDMGTPGADANGASQSIMQPVILTLESASRGLSDHFLTFVEGLNVVKLNLFDLDGLTVWSTDPGNVGVNKRESPLYGKAVAGGISSKLVKDHSVMHLDGVSRPIDVVETYLPLQVTEPGEMIGVMEIYRDVSKDVTVQVNDAKSTVLWTTVATMGGLFLVLSGFIVVADVSIFRGNKRELSLVERQLAERKDAEERLALQAEELARSNKDLEQFASAASHDLQEPLRMVSSYTQLLARHNAGKLDAESEEFIAFAVDGASRMRQLIDDLLVYCRVTTRAGSPEPTDSNLIFDDAVANLAAAIEESGASVVRDPLPTVAVDPTQMRQLFQNLIGNAMKYRGAEPPQVHVSAEVVDGADVFSVRDNGIGIDPKYADRVFGVFQRLHIRDEYPGTGIGLAICKKVVERHGGQIWIDSEPGKGSTFYFSIPL